MSNIIEYLDSKGLPWHPEGNEIVTTCPSCKKEKLYINKNTHLFQCFYCKTEDPDSTYAKGHISTLIEDMGDALILNVPVKLPVKTKKKDPDFSELVDRFNFNLKKNVNAQKYLYSRGFDDADIDRFKFGFIHMDGEDWISIPSFEDGIPKLLKYRKITNNDPKIKKYKREFGSKSILFNQDCLKDFEEVNICGGEFDAAMLLKNNYLNTVAATGGEGTLTTYQYDQLYLKEKFTILMDADKPGQNAARDVWSKRLGMGRCYNVALPEGEDVNSIINGYGIEQFEIYYNGASTFKIEGVISLGDALFQMNERSLGQDEIYSLPWPSLNQRLGGGIENKQLIVLGGQAGVGKTSAALQVTHHFAKVHNESSLFVCLEMSEIKLATKIVQIEFDLDYKDINPHEALAYAQQMGELNDKMFFGYSPTITPQIYYNTVKIARDRYGCGLFVFDNLQLLVVSDKESEYAAAVKMFKRIAMELDVKMLLVSQPRKLNSERTPTYDDLKGSASISQGADIVILAHRKRLDTTDEDTGEELYTQQSFSDKCTFIVDKARFASGGATMLRLIGNKSRFDEIDRFST